MKTILSEIKNFKRLTRIVESDDKDVKVALIGDGLTSLLDSSDFISTPTLRDEDMTIDKLLIRLSKQDKMPEVDHIFLSIGANDKFQDKNTIPFLIDALDNKFPNAEINVIKAIIDSDYFYGDEGAEDFKNLENDILSYYNIFKQNGLTVLGNYPSIDYGLGQSDSSVMTLKNQMSDSLFQNITNFGEKSEPLSIDEPFIYKNNIDISGDDYTDYDTIYEFLERFEDIVKSGNHYNSRVRDSFKTDIEQLQIALKFLMPNSDLEITGKFDSDTEEVVYNYQEQQGINANGVADQDTLEEMLFDLKVKSFDEDDLGKYLQDMGIKKSQNVFLDGEVEIIGLGGESKTNAQLMIDYMYEMGITNPYTQIGILSVIGKESGFIPQNEICYDGTPNGHIRELFGDRVPSDNDELDELKSKCDEFFDAVYGPEAQDEMGWNTGNDKKGDGYKYRGRGFNQITFKNTYKKIGDYIGEDLVSNPDRLNDEEVAAKAAVAFFTNGGSGSSLPDFTNTNDAINYFVDKNAGGHAGSKTRGKAFEASKGFKVIP